MLQNDAPLIAVDNVTVVRDSTPILTNFSWRVNRGEHWVVFGPNGAGKTSLLNVIQGYLWPTTGTVHMFGGTLGSSVDVREMRRQIPVVSEAVRRMIHDSLSGLEVLVTGIRAHLNIFEPVTRDEEKAARDAAFLTKIETLLDKPFGVMSTGERQRILITRALLASPQVVVLDEPCTGLDLAGREWVLRTVTALRNSPASPSLLLTTHHVEEIPDGFTHALLLNRGKVFKAGAIHDVFTSESLSELYDMEISVEHANGRWRATGS